MIESKIWNYYKYKLEINLHKSELIAVYRVGKKLENKPHLTLEIFEDNFIKMVVHIKEKLIEGWEIVIKDHLKAEWLKAVKVAFYKYGLKTFEQLMVKFLQEVEK